MTEDASAHIESEESRPRRRPWYRTALRALGILVTSVILLLAIIVLLLQTHWGAQMGTRIILGFVDPFDDAVLRIDEARGTFITRLDLRGVSIVHKDPLRGERNLVEVDSLSLKYSLRHLFSRRLNISEIHAVNPRIRMHQLADGSWDLVNILPVSEDVDTSAAALRIEMYRVALVNGSARVQFYPAEFDSVMAFDDINVHLRDFFLGDNVAVIVDSARLAMLAPGAADPLRASLAGALAENHLTVDELRLVSSRTDVSAFGSLQLPGDSGGPIRDIDFTLEARPLAFADIRPFVPTLDPARTVEIEAHVGGTSAVIEPNVIALVDDGASLAIRGQVATGVDGPVVYRLTGELRRLDPSMFTGGDRGAMLLSADLQTDLEGTSLGSLNGTARAVVFNSRFGQFAPDRSVLDARFRGGTASIDLRSGLRGAFFQTTGTIRPFDDEISYDLRGDLESLDFYRFTDGSAGASDINAAFRLRGRGIDPQTATINLDAGLRRSTINDLVIERGDIDLRLAAGSGQMSVGVALGEGMITAAGEVDFRDEISYRITRGRVDGLNLAALTGGETTGVINGTFSASGRGTDPQSMLLSARMDMDRSAINEITILAAAANVSMSGGSARFDGSLDLDSGAFDLAGTIRPFDNVPAYQITRGRFRNVDIGALTGSPDQTSNLTGSLVMTGRGFAPRTMVADARLDLSPSTLNRQEITAASLAIAVRRGEVRADGDVTFPEGRIQLIARAEPFLERPTYEIENGVFSGVDLGAITNNDNLSSRLAGTVRLVGEGFEPETMRLDAVVTIDESRLNRTAVRDGRIQFDVRNGFAHLAARAALEEGGLEVDARGRLFDVLPTYELQGSLRNVDIAGILMTEAVESSLTGSFSMEGRGFDLETIRLEGNVLFENSRYDEVTLTTARADFFLFDGLLHVDQMRVRSNIVTADGGGRLALFDPTGRYESDFSIRADVVSLDPIAPLIDARVFEVQSGSVSARFYGPPGEVRFDGTGDIRSFVYNDLRIAGFRGRVAGQFDPGLQVTVAEAVGEVDYFSTGDFSLQSTRFDVLYDDMDVAFNVEAVVDGRRDLAAAGRVDLRPDSRLAVIERVRIRLDNDRWELLDEATIAYGQEIRISNLLLFSGQQQIAIDGVINPAGNQNLIVTIEDFRVDAVADLLGYTGLGGVMNGFIDLTGPAEAPRLSGLLEADITTDGRPVGDMALNLDYDALRLNLDGLLTHDDGSRLTFDGHVPLDLRLVAQEVEGARPGVTLEAAEGPAMGEVRIDVHSDNFALNFIMPFMDREVVDGLDGRLDGGLQIGGTLESPILDGQLTVSQGRLRLPQVNLLVRDAEVNALLVDNRVEIQRAFARSGDGTMNATGSLNLQELTLGEWNIDVNMNRFLAINTQEYRFVVNGDVRLGGTTVNPIVSGNVRVISGDIWMTDESAVAAEAVALTAEDIRMLEQRFGYRATEADTAAFDFFEAMDLRLSLTLERNTWLRSRGTPNMDVQFTGNLDVTKAPNAEMVLFGNIDVIPERSRVRQFSRVFDITSGTIQFNGPLEEATVDFDAEYRVRARASAEDQVTIVLGISGRLDSLDLELYSRDPPGLDMADIVSYIAVGRPASEGFMLGGGAGDGELRHLASGAVLDQVAGWVEGVAGEELGLDVIEIEQDGLRGTMITAGKYLTRRLFVAVSQPIALGADASVRSTFREQHVQRILVEYEVTNWLLSRMTAEGDNVRIMFLWEYSY